MLRELNDLDKHRLLITAALGFSDGAYAPEFRFAGPEMSFRPLRGSCPLQPGDDLLVVRDIEMYQEPRYRGGILRTWRYRRRAGC